MTAKQDRGEETKAPIGRLSEGQRQCLRLVHEHKTSKEIALILGISRFTVDQRIERACRSLGVEGRGKAALLLAEHERGVPPERLVYDSLDIADGPEVEAPPGSPIGPRPVEGSQVAQEQAAYDAAPRHGSPIWRVLAPRGEADDLTSAARIKWIVQLTVQIVAAALILLAIAQAASTIAERTWPAKSMNTQ
jgi:DNA-binding CsgD family transcriptional regulator